MQYKYLIAGYPNCDNFDDPPTLKTTMIYEESTLYDNLQECIQDGQQVYRFMQAPECFSVHLYIQVIQD